MTGEYVRAPSDFPHISIVESDNYTSTENQDSSASEKYSAVMYTVSVYSNKTPGKKTEAKTIMNYIDAMMYKMNFTRISLTPVQNQENATIYRIVARYRAKTDGTNIFR